MMVIITMNMIKMIHSKQQWEEDVIEVKMNTNYIITVYTNKQVKTNII
jgi:hypothetical protein